MMVLRRTAPLGWIAVTAAIVLVARTLAYALAPQTPLAVRVGGQLGGPSPALVVAVALICALALACGVLWLASAGVGERAALAGEPVPRLRLLPVAVRALALWGVSSLAFAGLESYVHWRAGLGFHGLHCLVGPVHGSALPLLGGLSVLAAAIHGAAGHALRWVRRAVGGAVARAFAGFGRAPAALATAMPSVVRPSLLLVAGNGPRGPPRRAMAQSSDERRHAWLTDIAACAEAQAGSRRSPAPH
jgi:hypothetical protein